jgi:hypothetical protein
MCLWLHWQCSALWRHLISSFYWNWHPQPS